MMALNFKAAALPADAVEMGRIGDAFGVKGWVKIWPHSAQADALFNTKTWWLQLQAPGFATSKAKLKAGQPTNSAARLAAQAAASASAVPVEPGIYQPQLLQLKQHHDSIVALFAGVEDRDQAQALKGIRIWLSRADFPKLPNDEYYWIDLIGLDVINLQGELLGQVQELSAAGPQTLLLITPSETTIEARQTKEVLMIPFVDKFITAVDFASKSIKVDWQADYA